MYHTNNKGFGLVETLMSLIVVAILLSGFFTVMLNRNKGFQIEYNLTQLQRQGAMGINYFSRAVRLADYRISTTGSHNATYNDFRYILPIEAKIISGTSQSLHNNDTITVSYTMNKQDMFNCLAINAPLNTSVQTVFFLTENHELACAPVKDKGPYLDKIDVIIEGVEALRIRYGEDTDHDGVVNRYVAADFPGLLMERVIEVKLSMLLRTPEKANLLLDSKYYTLQDIELGPYNDHYVRKVYTTVIPIQGLPTAQKG